MRSEIRELGTQNQSANLNSTSVSETPKSILTLDRAMNELLTLADTVAKSRASILISGEFGTGKRTLARYVHEKSSRTNGALFTFNCRETALGDQEALFNSLIEKAQGSTLIFSEIWKLSPACQLKLYQAIQEGRDVRFIATSSRSLAGLVKNGEFREELFYRLNVVNLKVPNLESRIGDVEYLAQNFIKKWAAVHGKPGLKLSQDAVLLLNSHRFPNNIRELESVCERSVLLAHGAEILARDIHLPVPSENRTPAVEASSTSWKPGRTLDEVERGVILDALKHFDNNRTHTAKALGISIRTLRNKLAEFRVMGIKV